MPVDDPLRMLWWGHDDGVYRVFLVQVTHSSRWEENPSALKKYIWPSDASIARVPRESA